MYSYAVSATFSTAASTTSAAAVTAATCTDAGKLITRRDCSACLVHAQQLTLEAVV
jgi:hypothetical protein